jgi:uncharacterized membrane protein
MKIFKIRSGELIFGISILWLVFVLLSFNQFNPFQILNVIGFFTLILLPGALTVIIFRLKGLPLWSYIGLIVGFSMLELMVIVLIGNTLLPLIGINHPLDQMPLLLALSILIFGLSLGAYTRLGNEYLAISVRFFDSVRDCLLAFIPVIFVVMAVVGAIRLNDGADGTLTLIMLIAMAIYSAVLIYYSEKVGPNVIPVALFFVSLALLYMNSLRGWYTTGHDIQLEYRVFELAKTNGVWSIAAFRDAYNACMSITIFPTTLSNLLHVPNPDIYKVFFQGIFATVPSAIYLMVRRYSSATIAFLSAVYFVSFPTFFTDMSFLNRQEMAFVFMVLMFYVIFEDRISLLKRQIIFTMLGIGMMLSHYTTTYIVVALLILLAFMRPLVKWLGRYLSRFKIFADSGIEFLHPEKVEKPRIAIWIVIILVAATFVWTNILTNTASGSLYRVLEETVATMTSNAKEDSKSNDVSYSLLSWHQTDPNILFQQYLNDVVAPARESAPVGTYYASSTYVQYSMKVIPEANMPLTKLGTIVQSAGINVVAFNNIVRQASAKLLQVLVLVGIIVILFSSRFLKKRLDTEFVILTAGSIIFVLAQVVLPDLSVEYGLLRAFQQALPFLGVFIVVGSMGMLVRTKDRSRVIFASTFTLLFFLSSVGVFTQLLGGYVAQLNLNNSGLYYDNYYLQTGEVIAIDWLTNQFNGDQAPDYQAEVQTDRFQSEKVSEISSSDLNPLSDIYPGLVQKNSYVYLGFANTNKNQANMTYEGTLLSYSYPIQFLDDQKDLIYNDGDSRVYR